MLLYFRENISHNKHLSFRETYFTLDRTVNNRWLDWSHSSFKCQYFPYNISISLHSVFKASPMLLWTAYCIHAGIIFLGGGGITALLCSFINMFIYNIIQWLSFNGINMWIYWLKKLIFSVANGRSYCQFFKSQLNHITNES